MAGGRPSSYSKDVLKKAKEYIDSFQTSTNEVVPSVVGLCQVINRAKSTVYKWRSEPDKQEFSDILERIEEKQQILLVNGGLLGDFNSNIAKMMLTKHGFSDKQEIDHQSSDGSMSPTKIEIVAPEPE